VTPISRPDPQVQPAICSGDGPTRCRVPATIACCGCASLHWSEGTEDTGAFCVAIPAVRAPVEIAPLSASRRRNQTR
jgi:hypothetical protein